MRSFRFIVSDFSPFAYRRRHARMIQIAIAEMESFLNRERVSWGNSLLVSCIFQRRSNRRINAATIAGRYDYR